MKARWTVLCAAVLLLAPLLGCGPAEPTVTPAPPTPAPPTTTPPPADTRAQPTTTPTSTPTVAPPAPTPLPPLSGSGGGVIAFVSARRGNWDIYLMNADGTEVRQLTNHDARDAWPTWSPDGKRIAFMSERRGSWKVFVMEVDTGEDSVQLLTPNGINWEPAWSPDGTRIAFGSRRDGNSELYVMNADGTEQRRLTNHNWVDGYPCWSPDSTQIAFVSDRDGDYEVYVINADGTNLRQLTDNDADEWVPAWSPDGSRIAFASERDGNLEIYSMNSDGTDQRRLTNNGAEDIGPAWSPDGAQIAFRREEDGESDIYLIHADGTGERQLTRSRGEDGGPSWRPAAGGAASTPPVAAAVEVPRGNAPTIDGILSPAEWAAAYQVEITGGGELFLMQDGSHLYVGIRAASDVLGSLCVLRDNQVAVLHASAALGTAVYEQVNSAWGRVRDFSWSARDTSENARAQEARREFLEREGWLASITWRGNPEEMEYQIVIPGEGLHLAVAYLQGPDFDAVFGWPDGLDDACHDVRLAQGYTEESLQFAPDTWAVITLPGEE